MFSKKVTDSDAFIEMSSAAQALYFHLNQSADDDGFNNQIQLAMMKSHASVDDLKVLLLKNFVIRFESGVIVIKHWRIHNVLRKDRYIPTSFQEELAQLNIKSNLSYTLSDNGCQMVAERLPDGCRRLGKVRKGKVSLGKDIYIDKKDGGTSVPAYFPLDQQLDDAFKEFMKMRKKIKSPMTDKAVELMINKINKINDNNKAIECLNESIMNCWKGIYPNKDKEQKKASSNPFADMLAEMEKENDT